MLHAAATVVVGVGVFFFDQPATAGLLAIGGVLFVVGIVIARLDGDGPTAE